MSSSPSCSSTSPSTSTAATDLQETDAFSDDSGVDVKSLCKKPYERLFSSNQESAESGKRNKRKSSEPKKRKDVILMKRFRWDTDEEDNDDNHQEVDDVFDVGERPGSGDSGCQMEPNLTKAPDEKKKRQWRKPKVEKDGPVIKQELTSSRSQELTLPTFRQSVIKKHGTTSTVLGNAKNESPVAHIQSSGSCTLVPSPSLAGQIQIAPSSEDYSLLDEDIDATTRTSRAVGRPRNYKGMTKQKRKEANERERKRVHTLSEALENLRRAVPAYAHNQKLSKLAILRTACAYIVALACINDKDYSQEQSRPTLADCVEQYTRTVQAEGRSRRRTTKE